jgi:hypothetical protein
VADLSPKGLAKELLSILDRDAERLARIDDYLHGLHDDPYMPDLADKEYKLLAKRCVSNWLPLLVDTPAQALYVDGFRRAKGEDAKADSEEWKHWQGSRLDARQLAVHRGALTYGHSFTLTERLRNGKVRTKGLSALRTAAVFIDAANDDTPYAALTVTKWPGKGEDDWGTARLWDGKNEYGVAFQGDGTDKVRVSSGVKHGASECPVTRFAAHVDLEGRTLGVIEPMMALQDRINQTVFDLLVAQTYGSFKVRTATGMAPPIVRNPETGEAVLDDNGNPQAIPMNHNAKRFLFAEDENVRFGSLDETPLGGFIESIDMSIRHLSAISQVPPHHLLGQIANLSAEALQAAETALSRRIQEFRVGFGESWERVFRLAAEIAQVPVGDDDFSGEIIWRDMESRSLAQAADALGKLKEQLEIPKKGLWRRVPGVTQTELDEWEDLADQGDSTQALADALSRASSASASLGDA